VSFRLYKRTNTGLQSVLGSLKTSKLSGTYLIKTSTSAPPGDYFVEAVIDGHASNRLPVKVVGVQLTMNVPGATTVEAGPLSVSYTVTPATPGLEVVATFGGTSMPVVSPFSVDFNDPGNQVISLTTTAPNGCVATVARSVDVFACNPVLAASIVPSTPAPSSSASTLVCTGDSIVTSGNLIYVRAGATASVSGIGTAWLEPGASLVTSGIWNVLYTGTPPAGLGGIPTLFACPSISFDDTALATKCP
jgi:hypothetical protein